MKPRRHTDLLSAHYQGTANRMFNVVVTHCHMDLTLREPEVVLSSNLISTKHIC